MTWTYPHIRLFRHNADCGILELLADELYMPVRTVHGLDPYAMMGGARVCHSLEGAREWLEGIGEVTA